MALKVSQLRPNVFTGALLVAPMAKIADDLKPHPIVIRAVMALSRVLPTAAITPAPVRRFDFAFFFSVCQTPSTGLTRVCPSVLWTHG